MKLLFHLDERGWPDRLISETYEGSGVNGHMVFQNWAAVDEWKAANEHLRPENNRPPEPLLVPDEVPAWAFRSALSLSGIREAAEAEIDSLPEPHRTVAFEQLHGNFIERQHPLIDQLAVRMGLSPTQVDNLFRTAAGLSVQFRTPAPI